MPVTPERRLVILKTQAEILELVARKLDVLKQLVHQVEELEREKNS